MIPAPTNPATLPGNLIKVFDNRGDKTVLWFSSPPLDIVSNAPTHSVSYVNYLATKTKSVVKNGLDVSKSPKKSLGTSEMEVDEPGSLISEVDQDAAILQVFQGNSKVILIRFISII